MSDITHIRLQEEFVYLAVILDAFSRRVIGWALDRTLEEKLPQENDEEQGRSKQRDAGGLHAMLVRQVKLGSPLSITYREQRILLHF